MQAWDLQTLHAVKDKKRKKLREGGGCNGGRQNSRGVVFVGVWQVGKGRRGA